MWGDGRRGWTSAYVEHGGSIHTTRVFPTVDDINVDPQFQGEVINAARFDAEWEAFSAKLAIKDDLVLAAEVLGAELTKEPSHGSFQGRRQVSGFGSGALKDAQSPSCFDRGGAWCPCSTKSTTSRTRDQSHRLVARRASTHADLRRPRHAGAPPDDCHPGVIIFQPSARTRRIHA